MSVERLLDEQQADEDLQFLLDTAEAQGHARGNSVFREGMVKHIKALEMQRHNELSIGAQTREAEASEAYKDALLQYARAVAEYEKIKEKRVTLYARIDVFRTLRADIRSFEKVTR